MILISKYTPPKALVFDFETTGSNFESYEETAKQFQGISLGLIVFDTSTLLPIDKLYLEIKYDEKYKWSSEAEAIHGLSREHLAEHGLTTEDAACEVAEFLLGHFGPDPKIMVMGHNVDFDICFMEQLMKPFGLMFRLHHVKLNTASLSFIAFNSHKSNDLFSETGLNERAAHNALEDCAMTLEAARIIRMLIQDSLYG